jgi:hypothetical protein
MEDRTDMPTMVQAHPELPDLRPGDDITIASFDLHLHARERSANTRSCYGLALRLLAGGLPTRARRS